MLSCTSPLCYVAVTTRNVEVLSFSVIHQCSADTAMPGTRQCQCSVLCIYLSCTFYYLTCASVVHFFQILSNYCNGLGFVLIFLNHLLVSLNTVRNFQTLLRARTKGPSSSEQDELFAVFSLSKLGFLSLPPFTEASRTSAYLPCRQYPNPLSLPHSLFSPLFTTCLPSFVPCDTSAAPSHHNSRSLPMPLAYLF